MFKRVFQKVAPIFYKLHGHPPIVWIVMGLHLFWAAMIIALPQVAHTTALASLLIVFGTPGILAYTLILVSALALAGLTLKRLGNLRAICLLPQNFLMVIVAFGLIRFSLLGHYGDDTMRPTLFILADQFPYLTMVIAHIVALGHWTRWLWTQE